MFGRKNRPRTPNEQVWDRIDWIQSSIERLSSDLDRLEKSLKKVYPREKKDLKINTKQISNTKG
jgi:hypothetical protein